MHIQRLAIGILITACLIAPGAAQAGTTVITHGFNAGLTPPLWTLSMAKAILVEAGDESDCGAAEGAVGTVLQYLPSTGEWEFECGSTSPNGEIVLIFDWSVESDLLNEGGTQGYAEAAADAFYAALRDPVLPSGFGSVDLLSAPVHLIGHSRGTVVTSDCVERLANAGIAIDHVTFLDPHPVNGTLDPPVLSLPNWLDREPIYWSNVSFQDTYWRADQGGVNSIDFDGMSLPDSDVDKDLGSEIEGEPGDPPIEHSEVRAWYHGTVNQTADDDGGSPAVDINKDTDIGGNAWYQAPIRSQTGFYYSAIIGGTRPSDANRSDPEYSPTEIYNGDFEIVNHLGEFLNTGHAGWRYHGGDKSGPATPWNSLDPPPGSNYYVTLLSADKTLTHNRLYVDDSMRSVAMDFRVTTLGTNDRFEVILIDENGSKEIGSRSLENPSGWHRIRMPIPEVRRGTMQLLRLQISGGGDGVQAIVDVDNLSFAAASIPTVSAWGLVALCLSLVIGAGLMLRWQVTLR